MTTKRQFISLMTTLAVAAAVLGVHHATAQTPAAQTPTTQPSQQDVLREMLRNRSVTAPIMPIAPGEAPATTPEPTAATTQPAQKLLPDGTMVVRRTGRLVRQGQWWLFTFESDGKALDDPPMRILPCKWLEEMEVVTGNGTRSTRFIVTGRVTDYRGSNYLLPENVLVVSDMGNFQ